MGETCNQAHPEYCCIGTCGSDNRCTCGASQSCTSDRECCSGDCNANGQCTCSQYICSSTADCCDGVCEEGYCRIRAAGETCTRPSDCFTEKCTGNVCQCSTLNQPCYYIQDCCDSANETCVNSVCQRVECDDATCIALEQLCVPEENACGDPTTATSCTFATTNSVPSRDADGPILYDATAEDGTSADDTTNCPGGGYVVFIKAKYRDADGDAETTSLCAFTPVTDSAFFQWNTNDTNGSQGCANQEAMDSGSTATEGGFSIPLCFDPRPADFVFSVKDRAGNDSNPVCLALPPI